ncbi:MAG: leucine-rich repeat domain-containing protein, partial [Bacteroidia bacterium]|nr:leucine-rich repeat domain-containing protein [Bacteroidia bacterium]
MTGLVFSSSIQSVGSYGFCNCAGVTENLSLPESLLRLDDGAFRGCYNLTGTITIPSSIKDLGSYCFFECNNIQSFSVSASNAYYSSSNGVLYSKMMDTLFICPGKKSGTFTIPSTVRLIGSNAFHKCSLLTNNIQIPKLIDYIGYNAFYGCQALSSFSVEYGNLNFTAENGALYSLIKDRLLVCPALKTGSFVLPEGLLYVDPSAFSYCTQLSGYLNLPESVEYIGEYAFYGCSSLSGFTAAPTSKYYSTQDGLLFNKTLDTLYICPLSKTGSLTLPSSVRSLGKSSLDGCVGLSVVVLPSSLTEIGDYAFEYCTGLQNVLIPSSVEKLGKGAFYNCTGLKEFAIGLNVPPLIDYYFLDGIDKSTCSLVVPPTSKASYAKAPYWESFTQMSERSFTNVQNATKTKGFNTYLQKNDLIIDGLSPG